MAATAGGSSAVRRAGGSPRGKELIERYGGVLLLRNAAIGTALPYPLLFLVPAS
jgi:hypothetical protein